MVCCLTCGELTRIPFCWRCGVMWTITQKPVEMFWNAKTQPLDELILDLT